MVERRIPVPANGFDSTGAFRRAQLGLGMGRRKRNAITMDEEMHGEIRSIAISLQITWSEAARIALACGLDFLTTKGDDNGKGQWEEASGGKG